MESGLVGTTEPWKRAGKFSHPRGAGGVHLIGHQTQGQVEAAGSNRDALPSGSYLGEIQTSEAQ